MTVDSAPVHTVTAVSATRLVVALSTKIFTSLYIDQSEAAEPLYSFVPLSSIMMIVYVRSTTTHYKSIYLHCTGYK